jgi:hypothetical protein
VGKVRELVRRLPRAAVHVDRDAGRDREHPRAELLAVLEAVVRPERAQERLLERVVRPLATDAPAEERQHLAGVLRVERLERGNRRHGDHHRVKRVLGAACETWYTVR